MNKKLLCSLFMLITYLCFGMGSKLINEYEKQYETINDSIHRIVPNHPFKVNEKIKFKIHYGIINAGYSTLEIPKLANIRGNLCYVFQVKNRTNSFFDKIHKVRDKITSYADYQGLYSWKYEKQLREGSYHKDSEEIYYQCDHVVRKNKKKYKEIAPYSMDAICAFYYVRTQKLIPGQDIFFENHTDGKNYSIRVRVHKKETIETEFGKVKTILIEPQMKDPGVFKSTGKILIWLTDDSLKVPVQMKSKIMIGSFTASIEEYSGTTINFFE